MFLFGGSRRLRMDEVVTGEVVVYIPCMHLRGRYSVPRINAVCMSFPRDEQWDTHKFILAPISSRTEPYARTTCVAVGFVGF